MRAVVVAQVRSRTRARGGAGREDRNGGSAQTSDQAVRQPARPSSSLSSRERYLFAARTVLVRRENGGVRGTGTWQSQTALVLAASAPGAGPHCRHYHHVMLCHQAPPGRPAPCPHPARTPGAGPHLCHHLCQHPGGTPGRARTLPASWRHPQDTPVPLAAPRGRPAPCPRPGHSRTPNDTLPVPYQAPRAGPRRTGARARGAWWTRSGRSSAQCAPGSARRRTPGGRAGSRRRARHAGTRHARRRGR